MSELFKIQFQVYFLLLNLNALTKGVRSCLLFSGVYILCLCFRDTGMKYKAKYRSLVFNIKDPKNPSLFRRIADGSLSPSELVRLSAEELASQELAKWREQQTQHQLEMIRKSELDLLQMAKSVVMKTHKGEQVKICMLYLMDSTSWK